MVFNNSVILQWGHINTNGTIQTYNFPTVYQSHSITTCIRANTNAGQMYGILSYTSYFQAVCFYNPNDNLTTYISIGY